MPDVAFNANDPAQTAFLSALARGETGQSGTGALFEGTGGADLSSAPTDQYGFPQWGGTGNSHAAGIFQFQPATWDNLAAAHGLSFGSAYDQQQAAWYLAQDTYTANTGGRSLEADLAAGDTSRVPGALSGVWPSITSAFGDLFASGGGPSLGSGTISADTSGGSGGGLVGFIKDEFARFGLLIVGGLVVIVALWYLLSQSTGLPSPGDAAKAAAAAL